MEKLTSDARTIARHVFAAHQGVKTEPGFVRCACCGLSPYGVSSRPKSELISDSFSDLDLLLDPTAPDVCAGCAALLGGRPGDDPPPFRTLSACVLVAPDGGAGPGVLPFAADVARVLLNPPDGTFAVAWGASRKKHAWLRSEACDACRIVVGTDAGPVVYRHMDRQLLDAVSVLLAWFRRDAVESGSYPTPAVAAFGPARWSAAEAVVARHRPSALLSMLVTVLPRPERDPLAADTPVPEVGLAPCDEDAVTLLGAIAAGSTWRAEDGIAFWSHIFRRRVQRFCRLPLADFASRLLGELRVRPHSEHASLVSGMVGTWDAARAEACMGAVRARADLLIVTAYGRREKR